MIALAGFFAIWLLLWLPLVWGVATVLNLPWAYPVAAEHKIPLLLPLYGMAPLAVWVYSRYLADQTWSDYGLALRDGFGGALAAGFGGAVLGVLLLVAVEWGLGWRRLHAPDGAAVPGPQLLGAVIGIFALTGFIGGIEELVFRGVLVQGLLGAISPWAVVVAASLIFALSHLVWDGRAGIPSLPGLGLMGAVLMLARWVDGGSLGLPWGLHSGWIFAIALVDTLQLAPPAETPGSWLAGKPDQPLTGLPALGLLGLTGFALWGYHSMV